MKKILYVIVAISIFTSCQQIEKIGYVDNSKLMNDYQEKIDIESKLKIMVTAFQKRTDSLRKAFQFDVNEAEIKAKRMSQADIQKLSQELQQRDQVLSQRVQFEQQQIAQESKTLNDSLIKKVKDFVKDYGNKNGYSYILGSNEGGSVIFGKEENDLTQIILDLLNTQYKKLE
ncbi:MAG: OmpH family outer membrane protein [Flavobacteriaceae bacterium]|nr:OmpH family outer membrane protein [Flavobacteriaceae bacterium]